MPHKAEIKYLRMREAAERSAEDQATECAEFAHKTLGTLYRQKADETAQAALLAPKPEA